MYLRLFDPVLYGLIKMGPAQQGFFIALVFDLVKKHVRLFRRQAGIEPADNRHRQNHVPVFALHVKVPQDVTCIPPAPARLYQNTYIFI